MCGLRARRGGGSRWGPHTPGLGRGGAVSGPCGRVASRGTGSLPVFEMVLALILQIGETESWAKQLGLVAEPVRCRPLVSFCGVLSLLLRDRF